MLGLTTWLVVATVTSVLIGRMVRRRDRQTMWVPVDMVPVEPVDRDESPRPPRAVGRS